jgi:hypothetical protein
MSTIVIDLYPTVLQVYHVTLYNDLFADGFYGVFPGCNCFIDINGNLSPSSMEWASAEIRFEVTYYPPDTGFEYIYQPVPEPATWLLLFAAFIFVSTWRRLRRSLLC